MFCSCIYIFKGKTETHNCVTSVFCWEKTTCKEKKEITNILTVAIGF